MGESSDSSMDDCNKLRPKAEAHDLFSSDSSMDDCNQNLVLAFTCETTRSDSSMDDCNLATKKPLTFRWGVQIPLWTIVTGSDGRILVKCYAFRFLYGRL